MSLKNLSKNLEEISEGWFPVTVPSSWHVVQQTFSVQSHTEIKQKFCIMSGKGKLPEHCQELSSVQCWKSTLPSFIWGCGAFPPKFLNLGRALSWRILPLTPCLIPNLPPQSPWSEVDFKSRGFTSLQGSSKALNHPHLVGKEGQGTLKWSPSPSMVYQRRFREFRMLGRLFCHLQTVSLVKKVKRQYSHPLSCPQGKTELDIIP